MINACKTEWKPILGYEGLYEVSNKGDIRKCNGEPRLLDYDKDGYPRVSLWKNGKSKTFTVHRLVAQSFVENPNPTALNQINHIDEDKKNNFYMNLEWCDNLYNRRYGTGIGRSAEKNSDEVVATVIKTGEIEHYKSMNDAARQLDGDSGHISDAVNGKRKTAYGRTWKRKQKNQNAPSVL